MISSRWQVYVTNSGMVEPKRWISIKPEMIEKVEIMVNEMHFNVAEGTPYILSPDYTYDQGLNGYFQAECAQLLATNTIVGYARDIATFLTFLDMSREGTGWRDANEEDLAAYLHWRRLDSKGPQVSGSTWDRGLAALNKFYEWQVKQGHLSTSPIAQRESRQRYNGYSVASGRQVPAALSHEGPDRVIKWLPAKSYRQWRDVGLRGYTLAGQLETNFRGRWASRNATFADLMVRTGMRLMEQSSLLRSEIPFEPQNTALQKFWLPGSISKNRSQRWVYVPRSVVRDLSAYDEYERSSVVQEARESGTYEKYDNPIVVEGGELVFYTKSGVRRGKSDTSDLTPAERLRLLVHTPDGLEPAMFWLSEGGVPLSTNGWQSVFRSANKRCINHDLDLHCTPHVLRHTFAVHTLEQLQRAHILQLSAQTLEQRQYYVRIFGDPLDWVRRRLGHRSITTTQIYLHNLAELEMETRMSLIQDEWDDPIADIQDITDSPEQ